MRAPTRIVSGIPVEDSSHQSYQALGSGNHACSFLQSRSFGIIVYVFLSKTEGLYNAFERWLFALSMMSIWHFVRALFLVKSGRISIT